VEEPPLWRDRKREPARWSEMFTRPFIRYTVIATLLSSSVLIAYWGVMTWMPAFLASPIEKGGAGLTVTKSASWLILLQVGAFFGYITFGWFADRFGRRMAFTLFMFAAAAVVPLFVCCAGGKLTLLTLGPLLGYFAHGYFSIF